MKKVVLFFFLIQSSNLLAAEQSVLLSIPGMNCPVCPITIKKSLEKVTGVSSVNVSLENKTAVVSFNDKLTDTNSLLNATKNVGYPSFLNEHKK